MANIFGVPLFDRGLEAAIDDLLNICLSHKENVLCSSARLVSATGAHGLVTAQGDREFADILKKFYMNLPDGRPSVWLGRAKGARSMGQCRGPDFFREIMIQSRDKPIYHFFCGGLPGVAEELNRQCATKFGNTNGVGVYSPPFRPLSDEEFENLGKQIDDARADVVWIGLSTPKQEKFASRLCQYTRAKFIVTVGAAFDYHTGSIRQPPAFIQKMGMEWFFRLCMDPARLYKRYLKVIPLFIWYAAMDLVKYPRETMEKA